MKGEKLDVVRGSGNVFRDLRQENADAKQFKAILAAEIVKALDREHLSVRAAHARTGNAAADFSRIRNADLGRFTIDRLMSIINRLGSRVDVKVKMRRVESIAHEATLRQRPVLHYARFLLRRRELRFLLPRKRFADRPSRLLFRIVGNTPRTYSPASVSPDLSLRPRPGVRFHPLPAAPTSCSRVLARGCAPQSPARDSSLY